MKRGDRTWPGYAQWIDTVLACRREFVRVARSFWLIPELIPVPARDDISLLYCVCRRLDDAVDEAADISHARAALAQWRDELAGRAEARPLVAAFLAGVPRTGLPMACMEHLLDGMELDLGDVRIADDEELLRYAYRVSAAVGLMLAPLLGIRGAAAEQRVVDLGLALQLSNILLGRAYAELGRRAARGEATPEAPAQLPRVVKALRLVELFATAWHPRTLGFISAPPHDPALHRAIAGWHGAHEPLARVTP